MTETASSGQLPAGLLDTCVLIDLEFIDAADLPLQPQICTLNLAELGLGIARADTPEALALRTERLLELEHNFEALPFCAASARRFMSLSKLVVAAGRNPKPRKVDLMIAAIASVNDLPLYTRNPDDFKGTEKLLTMISV